jgi:glycosyltransferase involved in cell wall biosynthesis
MLSLVLPIYRSEVNLPALLEAVRDMDKKIRIEAVFVVDGSPDRSAELLEEQLPVFPVRSQLIQLSRNFVSFSSIRAGLEHGTGDYFAMLAADLQEPPELILRFVELLESGQADIVIGQRASRDDPWFSRLLSSIFWKIFRQFAVADMPAGGVDTFGCTRAINSWRCGRLTAAWFLFCFGWDFAGTWFRTRGGPGKRERARGLYARRSIMRSSAFSTSPTFPFAF